jgi:uncharacterized membrane protein YfcA
MTDLLTLNFLALLAIVVGAGLLRGFTGFGAALVMAPLMSLTIGPREAAVAVILLTALTSFQQLPEAWPHVRWRRALPLGLAAAVAAPFGTAILAYLPLDLLQRTIAGVVVVFALVLLSGWRYRGEPRWPLTIAVGASGGLLTGIAGIGGPPVVLYLLGGHQPAATNRADFIVYFALSQFMAAIPLFWFGLVDGDDGWRVMALLVPFALATWIGGRLFYRAAEAAFRRVALGFLLVVGVVTLAV